MRSLWRHANTCGMHLACDADELECDYLCIGAGTSTLSFVDTMLSSTDESITFVIVDKQPAAGGHWNVAYPFVTLHQPSGAYGVPSEPLGKVKNGREIISHDDCHRCG